jgi:dTDP-4-amino-4,6-dideoxygalactose transaminase
LPSLAIAGGKPTRTRPLISWPIHGEEEERRILEVVRSGKWWFGENVKEFERKFADFQDARFGITCPNGTIGMIIALKALGIDAGDEVIMPAYSFFATASAVAQINAIPVFADIEEETCNIDLDHAETLVTERTRALMVVHIGGLPVDMERARDFAKRHNLKLIEDACHSWGSKWNGKGTGAIGDAGSFSFQMSKNITSAEGGIVLTDEEELAKVLRSYTHVGRLEGRAWYEHFIIAGNNRMTEMQAALLLAQLERLGPQTERREENVAHLNRALADVPGIVPQPRDPRVTRRSHHMYFFRFVARDFGGITRQQFMDALNAEGVPCSGGYLHPMYKNACFQTLNDSPRPENRWLSAECNARGVRLDRVKCPVTERLCAEEIVWLPQAILLEERSDMDQIAEAIHKVHEHQDEIAAVPAAR